MRRYVTHRLLSLALIWLFLTTLAFGLAHLAPGDPAELLLERTQLDPVRIEDIRRTQHQMGLDRPLLAQYAQWLRRAVTGDLGTSWATGQDVSDLLNERFPRTAGLAAGAFLISLLIALPVGMLSANQPNSIVDHVGRIGASVLASFPSFVLAYILILILGVKLAVLPVFGFGSLRHLVLPVLTLSIIGASELARLTRSAMLDVVREDYIRTAQAKGVGRARILFHHALRNALNPIVTFSGLRLGFLLSGTVIIETIFAWPGLGKLAVDGIYARDYPLMQGFVVFTGTVFVLVNLAVDLCYAWLDPRVRVAGRRA